MDDRGGRQPQCDVEERRDDQCGLEAIELALVTAFMIIIIMAAVPLADSGIISAMQAVGNALATASAGLD